MDYLRVDPPISAFGQSGQVRLIEGTVLEQGGGVVSSAVISVSSPGVRPTTIATDVRGYFSLRLVGGSSYNITAAARGYMSGGYGQAWPRGPIRPFHVQPASERQSLVIYLWRFASVTGVVTHTDGSTASHIAVRLLPTTRLPGALANLVLAETDTAGQYHFESVPPGKYVVAALPFAHLVRLRTSKPSQPPM